jgi:phosphoglycerate dehydrogenase-like enzyme
MSVPFCCQLVLLNSPTVSAEDLKELLSSSDLVSLHIPGHARHLIGREESKCLKDGAVFISFR